MHSKFHLRLLRLSPPPPVQVCPCDFPDVVALQAHHGGACLKASQAVESGVERCFCLSSSVHEDSPHSYTLLQCQTGVPGKHSPGCHSCTFQVLRCHPRPSVASSYKRCFRKKLWYLPYLASWMQCPQRALHLPCLTIVMVYCSMFLKASWF